MNPLRPIRRTTIRGLVLACAALCGSAPDANAFFERLDASARALAFGEAYLPLATDASSVTCNPGALGAVAFPEVQLSLARPYFVPQLASNAISAVWPRFGGGIGAAWHRLGNEFVAEDQWFLSYGRWAYRDDRGTAFLGGALKVAHVGIDPGPLDPQLGGKTVVAADLGGLYRMESGLSAAAVIRNLGEPEIRFDANSPGTVWKTAVQAGLAYRWHPESTVSIGWSSAERARDAWRAGGEIWFYDAFAIRAGILGAELAGGFGLKTKRLEVDASFVTHAQLGLSSRVTLVVPVGGWR